MSIQAMGKTESLIWIAAPWPSSNENLFKPDEKLARTPSRSNRPARPIPPPTLAARNAETRVFRVGSPEEQLVDIKTLYKTMNLFVFTLCRVVNGSWICQLTIIVPSPKHYNNAMRAEVCKAFNTLVIRVVFPYSLLPSLKFHSTS